MVRKLPIPFSPSTQGSGKNTMPNMFQDCVETRDCIPIPRKGVVLGDNEPHSWTFYLVFTNSVTGEFYTNGWSSFWCDTEKDTRQAHKTRVIAAVKKESGGGLHYMGESPHDWESRYMRWHPER